MVVTKAPEIAVGAPQDVRQTSDRHLLPSEIASIYRYRGKDLHSIRRIRIKSILTILVGGLFIFLYNIRKCIILRYL